MAACSCSVEQVAGPSCGLESLPSHNVALFPSPPGFPARMEGLGWQGGTVCLELAGVSWCVPATFPGTPHVAWLSGVLMPVATLAEMTRASSSGWPRPSCWPLLTQSPLVSTAWRLRLEVSRVATDGPAAASASEAMEALGDRPHLSWPTAAHSDARRLPVVLALPLWTLGWSVLVWPGAQPGPHPVPWYWLCAHILLS